MNEKTNAAFGAYEIIKNSANINLGIGTGSTTNAFIENNLNQIKDHINMVFSSSEKSTALMRKYGFKVEDGTPDFKLDFYVDGADEFDQNKCLIKGGGGAHTKEKILASSSKCFICIADSTKRVEQLGAFPLPIEVIPFAKDSVLHALEEYSENIIQRDFITDSGNIIFDLHGADLRSPKEIETKLNLIPGVVDNGIFAHHVPRYIVVGNSEGYELIES